MIDFLPAGTVIPYAGKSSSVDDLKQQGWLLCDGAIKKKTDYPELFKAIGYAAGNGNTDSEFRLPDFRGMFLRGVDTSGNVDPDVKTRRAEFMGGNTGASPDPVCSFEDDAFRAHAHSVEVYRNDGLTITNSGDDWSPPNVIRSVDTKGTGGAETRPKNAYVYFIIYAGANTGPLGREGDAAASGVSA